ncbi:hypothetical protein [Streptomyces spinosirectus]
MRDGENELCRHADARDGASYPSPYPGLLGACCPVPSQGEIGSLIAVTVAANLALAHQRGARLPLAHPAQSTTEQGSH